MTGLRVRFKDPGKEISAVLPLIECETCSVSSITPPTGIGPYTAYVGGHAVVTSLLTFSNDCSETLTYTYSVT